MRIDAPHVGPAGAEQAVSAVAGQAHADVNRPTPSDPVLGGEATAAAQQLRTQTVQLADHLARRQEELDRREAELDARATELEAGLQKARAWFGQRESDLEHLRQRWIDQRRQAEAELDAARRRLDEEHRRDWADLQEKRRSLERRSEQVDCAAAALHQVQEEVNRTHRETLELRLVNEALRAEIGSALPADAIERMLREARARVSAEYRRESQRLSRQKLELLALHRDLAQQHRKLGEERQRLHRLAARVTAGAVSRG